jgi:hypothetical protein
VTQFSGLDKWGPCTNELRSVFGDAVLSQYTTSNAARDYNLAVEAVRKDLISSGFQPQEVWFYAFSYGTFLLNRILTLFPSIAHGVIMDGWSDVWTSGGSDVQHLRFQPSTLIR